MKKVLMSIHPQWCEKIFNGSKTIEVRKTAPKIDTPFEVLVYETKKQFVKSVRGAHTKYGYGRGQVIGSFVCDGIIDVYVPLSKQAAPLDKEIVERDACLSLSEIQKYAGNKMFLRGLHITEPKLFDKPKELSEFYMPCKWYEKGDGCGDNNCPLYEVPDYEYGDVWHDCEGRKPLTRPPQSWCYIDSIDVEEV